jgi:hypothetical protein
MKLGQYIQELLELQQQVGPDVDLHYSTDDEGNSFPTVNFSPSIHYIEKRYDDSDLYNGDISLHKSIDAYVEDYGCSINEAEAELRPIIVVN